MAVVHAQPPRGERGQGAGSVEAAVGRLMAFDADGDGKLSKIEITDSRLQALFQRADANNDGVVTKEELTAQLTKDATSSPRGGAGGGPGGPNGPGGRGPAGPGGDGPGGPPPDDRGPGGRGPGGPQPGQILPAFLQDELNLTDAQRRDIQELQKDVDARLAKILTSEQQQQMRQLRNRGPGGGPGGGGPRGPAGGGPAGPGGRPARPQ